MIKERNVRKKLYKSGKSWVIGGLILSTIMLSMTATSQNVNADSTNTVTDKSVTVSNNSNTTNQHDTVVDKQTTPVKNDQTTQQIAANATQAEKVKASDTTTDTQRQAETANNTNKDSIDNLTKQLPTVTPTANQKTGYLEKDGKWYYVTSDNTLAKGLTTVDNHKQYFDNNGVQAKGQFVTITVKHTISILTPVTQ